MLGHARCAGGTLGALILLSREAWACAVCLGWGDGGPNWGYYWSWVILTLLPFVVVGVIGAWIWHALRRSTQRGARAEPPRA